MSKFNKRHYEAIALCIQGAKKRRECIQNYVSRCDHYNELASELADLFKSDNPLFDRERFLFACEPGRNVKAKTAHLRAV